MSSVIAWLSKGCGTIFWCCALCLSISACTTVEDAYGEFDHEDYPKHQDIRIVSYESDGILPDRIAFAITNSSLQPICLSRDVFESKASWQLELMVRRPNGKLLKRKPTGYILPQIQGTFALEPGESVTGMSGVSGRFKEPKSTRDALQAKLLLSGVYCEDDEESVRETEFILESDWVPLTEPAGPQ